jgi:ring-1,2-phenylacetyl-CoA epoxidase subunit PaaD
MAHEATAPELWALLAEVPDPEIPPVSIVDLGMVRRVEPRRITLTPTYTGCPATHVIERSVREALDKAGYADVELSLTLSPPWSTDWITETGRNKLLDYGIAPPPTGESRSSLQSPPACPRCGSARTAEISRFGSTPCKALWRCTACAEPFDRFKCL